MTKPDFKVRSRQLELMDAPDVDPAELDHAMHHLEVINRLLNGYGPSIAGVRKLVGGSKSFSLLDVGCGSGDTLRHIVVWARHHGIACRLEGIELSARSAERAAEACADYPEIAIRQKDLFAMTVDEPGYDIVHSALVLHHFSEDSDVVRALRQMGNHSRRGVIVNDLHRHPLAWHSIRMLTLAFSRSPILQNDAPLSVSRAFTRRELISFAEKAGLQDIEVRWFWAFRWLLTARHRKEQDA